MDKADLWSQTTCDSGLNSSGLLARAIMCMAQFIYAEGKWSPSK